MTNTRKEYHHEWYLKNKDRIIKRHLEYNKEYVKKNREKVNNVRRKHYNDIKNKINQKRRMDYILYNDKKKKVIYEWRKKNRDKYLETRRKNWERNKDKLNQYQREWSDKHREYVKERARQYHKTENGKLAVHRGHAKRKKLESNVKFENILDEPYIWHHINNKEVVAFPVDLHQLYGSNDTKIHRESLKYIVEQLYPL